MNPLHDHETLDPDNWDEIRRTFHAAVDICIDGMRGVRDRPVWQPVPEEIKALHRSSAPPDGQPLDDLLMHFKRSMLPYSTGNTHPRFFGWVHGSGCAAGALGEMLAAFMNCNAGGRDHIATYVEREILDWCKQIFGFPASSSGITTTGTSMATIIALTVARNARAGDDVQRHGVGALRKRLVGYTSAEGHCCLAKSFELIGLGSDALRRVPVTADGRMNTELLARMIAADRGRGCEPFVVCATAGTVNRGAIDDLDTIADICRDYGSWMHVDGAFGGLAILTPEFKDRLKAIARADSLAFDFHKWLHVPYDAGCVLIKNEPAHRAAFSARREYLAGLEGGLAGGDPWFCEYGPELSRGFRSLKVWFTIKAYGIERLGRLIARNCRQAELLATLVRSARGLELLADAQMNIVCFRFVGPEMSGGELDALNCEIVTELQVRGIAAPSTTRIDGKLAIRVALTNHRTHHSDLSLLVEEVCRIGCELMSRQSMRAGVA